MVTENQRAFTHKAENYLTRITNIIQPIIFVVLSINWDTCTNFQYEIPTDLLYIQ